MVGCMINNCEFKMNVSKVSTFVQKFPALLNGETENNKDYLQLLNLYPKKVSEYLFSDQCNLKSAVCIDKIYYNKGINPNSGITCYFCGGFLSMARQVYHCNHRQRKFCFFFCFFFFLFFFDVCFLQKAKIQTIT